MNLTHSKYTVKIPANVFVIYNENKHLIIIVGPLKKKCIKLKLKLSLYQNLVFISPKLINNLSNSDKKKIKSLQGTTKALITQAFVETSFFLFQKLQLIGVGYRAFPLESYENQILMFKLGYSHSIYFRILPNLNVFCFKFTKLFFSSNSFNNLTQMSSLIRSYRKPEPYKGKGILYENEKVKMKEGKKT